MIRIAAPLWWRIVLIISFLPLLAWAQSTPAVGNPSASSLSENQIRDLIRRAAERDMENDKQATAYTYIERAEEHKLDKDGQVKFSESKTYEVMALYGEQVQRLIAKDDKPLPAKEAAKEDEKIQKLIENRKSESDSEHRKRLEKEEKDREEDRAFVKEIADAYNFRLSAIEQLEGRPTYVIDTDPRQGYDPRGKNAKFLPKFRFRVWIDQAEEEWVKVDIQCIETVSVGLFLARVHQGSNIQVEQTQVNNEVWLPKHVALKLDARLLLFKGVEVESDVTYRDYKKFRTDTKIVPAGEATQP